TQYFSTLLLYIFAQAQGLKNEDEVRSQISRVLVERLVVQRPHPWGLIYTLLELLRNSNYDFWNLAFVKSSPEVRATGYSQLELVLLTSFLLGPTTLRSGYRSNGPPGLGGSLVELL